jgi:hypothetical protein
MVCGPFFFFSSLDTLDAFSIHSLGKTRSRRPKIVPGNNRKAEESLLQKAVETSTEVSV